MRKYILSIIFSIFLSGVLQAEGYAFTGIDLGYMHSKITLDNYPMRNTSLINSIANRHGIDVGLMGGYEAIIEGYNSLGWRVYGNIDYQHFFKAMDNKDLPMLNIGLGGDFLWNFVNAGDIKLGLFAGLGVGLSMYFIDDRQTIAYKIYTINTTPFTISASAGLSMTIYRYLGLEMGVKIPIYPTKLEVNLGNEEVGAMKFDNNYNVFLRLVGKIPTN